MVLNFCMEMNVHSLCNTSRGAEYGGLNIKASKHQAQRYLRGVLTWDTVN